MSEVKQVARHDHKRAEGPCYQGFCIGAVKNGVEYLQVAATISNLSRLHARPLDPAKIMEVRIFRAESEPKITDELLTRAVQAYKVASVQYMEQHTTNDQLPSTQVLDQSIHVGITAVINLLLGADK